MKGKRSRTIVWDCPSWNNTGSDISHTCVMLTYKGGKQETEDLRTVITGRSPSPPSALDCNIHMFHTIHPLPFVRANPCQTALPGHRKSYKWVPWTLEPGSFRGMAWRDIHVWTSGPKIDRGKCIKISATWRDSTEVKVLWLNLACCQPSLISTT